jgi:GNAT superfamily N-acetyltransferase
MKLTELVSRTRLTERVGAVMTDLSTRHLFALPCEWPSMRTEVDLSLTTESASELRALYDDYPPWAGRSEEETAELIKNTDEVIGIWNTETDTLVASARVLTDYQQYSMIYEVIVAETHRGENLGEQVVGAIVTHPRLQDVILTLRCREELVPFYDGCGFELRDRDVEMPVAR